MKYLFAIIITLNSIFAFGNDQNNTQNSTQINYQIFDCIELPAGTLVYLETTEKVFSRQMTIGQLIQFKVKSDVVVNGKVVIATGSAATGRVKFIKNTTYNNPEEISIEVTSVQTVDGQMIALNGTEQTIRGTFTGQGTSIYPGTPITANVMNNSKILLY